MTGQHNPLTAIADLLNLAIGPPDNERSWRREARCLAAVRDGRAHPDDWFPGRGGNEHIEHAKAICHSCPVRLQCLQAHIWEEHGIWGGETEKGRKDIRNGRRGVA